MSKLKPYMAYDDEAGSCEGAVLVFAENYKQAKKICYEDVMSLFGGEYIGVRVSSMKNNEVDLLKLSKSDMPHVIDDPPCCRECEHWGDVLVQDDICDQCECDLEDN